MKRVHHGPRSIVHRRPVLDSLNSNLAQLLHPNTTTMSAMIRLDHSAYNELTPPILSAAQKTIVDFVR